MYLIEKSVTLDPPQIETLNKKLSTMRHTINNQLALIVAATELAQRKNEMPERSVNTLLSQPEKIIAEIRQFSDDFEKALNIDRVQPPEH